MCSPVHHVPKCMSCHKVIVVITGRAHGFIYICTQQVGLYIIDIPSNVFNEATQYANSTISEISDLTVIKISSNIQEKLCSFIATNAGKRNLEI